MPKQLALACFGLLAVGSVAARAEELAKARLDLSTPDVPAFTALGVSPSKISTPTNVKDFVAALSSGISPSGQVHSGVAIEVAPAQLLLDYAKKNPDESVEQLAKYVGGLAISIGTNALANAATPTMQAAAGLRWALGGYTPQADPKLANCIVWGIPQVKIDARLDENGQPIDASGKPIAPVNPDTPEGKRIRQTCRDQFRAAHLATKALQIAYVHSAQAVGDTKISTFTTLADTVWVSGSWAFNKVGDPEKATREDLKVAWGVQPTLFARFDAINLGSGAGRQSNLFVAARLPYITAGWSAFVEGGYQKLNLSDKDAPPATGGFKVPFGVGGDLRLGNGTWFGVYAGWDFKSGEIFALGNVKWSMGEKRPYEY